MKMLERFRRTPRKETVILNREQVGAVVDKLLVDLKGGFIHEMYDGDVDEESCLKQQSYKVVLKGGRYYLIEVFRSRWSSDVYEESLHVSEYRSVEEMEEWNNIQRYLTLKGGFKMGAHRGHPYTYRGNPAMQSIDISFGEAADLLRAIAKARVDTKTTQRHFEHQLEKVRRYNWKDIIVRWPKLSPDP